MRHLRKLSRKQKIALTKMELNPGNYLRLKQDYDSFTVVDIRTGRVLPAIRY